MCSQQMARLSYDSHLSPATTVVLLLSYSYYARALSAAGSSQAAYQAALTKCIGLKKPSLKLMN